MADKFLTIMADLDDASQKRLSEWYSSLEKAGFIGTQTPGLPYHISIAAFPPEQEKEIIELMKKLPPNFPSFRFISVILACLPVVKSFFAHLKETHRWMRFTTHVKRMSSIGRTVRGHRMLRF